MIAYRLVLLNDPDTINEEHDIVVQYGTEVIGLCGTMVRSFIKCTNKGCVAFPTYTEEEVLEEGLSLIPPEFRPVLKFLYKKLKG